MTMSLIFSPAKLDRLTTVDYWKALNPGMSITDYPFETPADTPMQPPSAEVARCVQQMREEGHFRLESMLPKARMARMAEAVSNIVDRKSVV